MSKRKKPAPKPANFPPPWAFPEPTPWYAYADAMIEAGCPAAKVLAAKRTARALELVPKLVLTGRRLDRGGVLAYADCRVAVETARTPTTGGLVWWSETHARKWVTRIMADHPQDGDAVYLRPDYGRMPLRVPTDFSWMFDRHGKPTSSLVYKFYWRVRTLATSRVVAACRAERGAAAARELLLQGGAP